MGEEDLYPLHKAAFFNDTHSIARLLKEGEKAFNNQNKKQIKTDRRKTRKILSETREHQSCWEIFFLKPKNDHNLFEQTIYLGCNFISRWKKS